MSPFVQAVAASVLAGFASMGIAFSATSRFSPEWLKRMVSFAAGLMLTLALLDLLPEALEGGLEARTMFGVLLATLMALFAIDFNLHAGCRHSAEGVCAHDLARPIPMILVGGALHVFTDGLMLGAAFLVDPVLAWGMTFAVLAHEVPREAGAHGALGAVEGAGLECRLAPGLRARRGGGLPGARRRPRMDTLHPDGRGGQFHLHIADRHPALAAPRARRLRLAGRLHGGRRAAGAARHPFPALRGRRWTKR